MIVVDGQIRMSQSEWTDFQDVNWAPWKPRTAEEFNAMCDLAVARHRAENTGGFGEIFAQATLAMKFSPDGMANFPLVQQDGICRTRQ